MANRVIPDAKNKPKEHLSYDLVGLTDDDNNELTLKEGRVPTSGAAGCGVEIRPNLVTLT